MLGKKIKEIREAHGYSQAEMAKILKVKQRRISHWELDKRKVPSELLLLIAKKFNKDMDFFLEEEQETAETPKQTLVP